MSLNIMDVAAVTERYLSDMHTLESTAVSILVVFCGLAGLLFAWFNYKATMAISLFGAGVDDDAGNHALLQESEDNKPQDEILAKTRQIQSWISEGANAFLYAEYRLMGIFMAFFSVLIVVLIGATSDWTDGVFTAIAFLIGATTSILSGWVGMRIAVAANARVTVQARKSIGFAFTSAFKAGCVMGFALVGNGILILYIMVTLFNFHYKDSAKYDASLNSGANWASTAFGPLACMFDLSSLKANGGIVFPTPEDLCPNFFSTKRMFEAVAGYGLGGSSIALFGRVGGGIYTKAADVGADLTGKLEFDIPEDDPRNPAVIADNVGDNVGDIAGMGADLFGSFAEGTCAAMVITSQSPYLYGSWSYLMFPIMITATGTVVGIITTFVSTHLIIANRPDEVEPSLKRQLLVSTFLQTPVIFLICWLMLPHDEFGVSTKSCIDKSWSANVISNFAAGTILPDGFPRDGSPCVHYWYVFFCVAVGLWSGLTIGYITEYYTSHSYSPVREVSNSCQTGAATDIIYGLALGYESVIIPVFCLAISVYVGFSLAGMYGIACAALGILSTMATGLTIDAFGPICDNAGGIAEMAGFPHEIREKTDALDAAGNTTAAIGKGFAIGSAALVSLALFGGYTTITGLDKDGVNILEPFQFAGLLVGAMLPYWFSAMTMKSVGKAANGMVEEVRRQFRDNPGILAGTADADYSSCVKISTDASLKEMIAPGALVMVTPLVVGYFFGEKALAGVLSGALVSGVQMAISMSNSGGAWDNAKKYIESGGGGLGGKGSDAHKAAVCGDTVGDPMKDTSGPSLNILIKLTAIISLVFARSFPSNNGGLLGKLF